MVEYDRRDLLHSYLDTHNSLVDCTLDPKRCGFTPLALALLHDRHLISSDSPIIRTLLTYKASLAKAAQSFEALHDQNREGFMLYHEFLKGLGPLDATAPRPIRARSRN